MFAYLCKSLVYLQDKKRIYVDLFDVNKRKKDKSNVKILILGLLISTSISKIQWNRSMSFTLNGHHLWWDRHWQNISSSEEETATKTLKQWFEVTEQVNDNSLLLDRSKFTEWQGLSIWRSQDRKESIYQEWKQFEKQSIIFPYFNNNKISISILKPILKLLTRSWSTFESSWSCRITSKTSSFIMCAVSFSKGQQTFLDKKMDFRKEWRQSSLNSPVLLHQIFSYQISINAFRILSALTTCKCFDYPCCWII